MEILVYCWDGRDKSRNHIHSPFIEPGIFPRSQQYRNKTIKKTKMERQGADTAPADHGIEVCALRRPILMRLG